MKLLILIDSGTLGGFQNGLCSVAGLLSPLIIGAILEQDVRIHLKYTQNLNGIFLQASIVGWRMAFALSAGIFASSAIMFLFTFTGRVQSWNDLSDQQDKEASKPMRAIYKP
jgi:hypothetical protein